MRDRWLDELHRWRVRERGPIEVLGAIVADVQAGFNDNDPELLAAHFSEDATAVNVLGVRLEGREAMVRSNRELLAGPFKQERARYELGETVFLTADVARSRPTVRIGHTELDL